MPLGMSSSMSGKAYPELKDLYSNVQIQVKYGLRETRRIRLITTKTAKCLLLLSGGMASTSHCTRESTWLDY